MTVVHVVVFLVGLFVLQAVLRSAVRTVVVPQGEQVLLSRVVFLAVRDLYRPFGAGSHHTAKDNRALARFAPMALLTLAFVWAAGVFVAFAAMMWAASDLGLASAMKLSGSSLTTLGFAPAPNRIDGALAIVEALIGLGVVALLIAYLPTIYAHFSSRETDVLELEVRAGSPPSAAEFLVRLQRIGWTDRLDEVWAGWEHWFAALEESHSSHPALVLFRSQRPTNSWITAAGAVLDTAALSEAALDAPSVPQAAITLRSGYLSLRAIAEFYGLRTDPDPAPNAPISITRAEFDEVLDELAAGGVPLVADREQAWRDFAGWRVNYDEPLLALCALCAAPPARWSSDRCHRFSRPTLRHPRRWRVVPLETGPSW